MWNAPNSEYVDHPRPVAEKSRRRLDEETLCMADAVARDLQIPASRSRPRGRALAQRKSIVAFLFALPLILIVACLVIYPAFYSMHLATLNKSMTKFVGFGNFEFLFKRNTFWMVVEQSVLFAVTAVVFKAVIGFVVAHFVHNIPSKGQRKWRGMLLIPWVIPPAMSTLAWLWLFDPSYSAFNWILTNGGPVDQTHVFATWAFTLGIWGNDIPLGASVSLFMFPILAVAAGLILRNIRNRGNEA